MTISVLTSLVNHIAIISSRNYCSRSNILNTIYIKVIYYTVYDSGRWFFSANFRGTRVVFPRGDPNPNEHTTRQDLPVDMKSHAITVYRLGGFLFLITTIMRIYNYAIGLFDIVRFAILSRLFIVLLTPPPPQRIYETYNSP